MATDVRVVLVTAPDAEVGARLGRTVVSEGLAACANLIPGLTSIYRWEGELRTDAEVLLLLKTTAAGFDALRDRVVQLHPYDVPEVLGLEAEAGFAPYLDWVRAGVGPV